MADVRLRTVDSFTDKPFTGNPAAVLLLDEATRCDSRARPGRWSNASRRAIGSSPITCCERLTRRDVAPGALLVRVLVRFKRRGEKYVPAPASGTATRSYTRHRGGRSPTTAARRCACYNAHSRAWASRPGALMGSTARPPKAPLRAFNYRRGSPPTGSSARGRFKLSQAHSRALSAATTRARRLGVAAWAVPARRRAARAAVRRSRSRGRSSR